MWEKVPMQCWNMQVDVSTNILLYVMSISGHKKGQKTILEFGRVKKFGVSIKLKCLNAS